MSATNENSAMGSRTIRRLLVNKRDFDDARIDERALDAVGSRATVADVPPAVAGGQVLFRLDRCGFSANNITYVALGDSMHYWDFFPSGDSAWGCVPVWGYAVAIASGYDGVAVGDRYFGYWPMASHCVATPKHATPHGFIDGAAHRAALPAVYNQYQRTAGDPKYKVEQEDAYMLLRPLFITSFMLHDFLDEHAYFGATTLVVSSASSKTAYALAFFVSQQGGARPRIVGLTSPGNLEYVRTLGCYDDVIAYDAAESLAGDERTVYADFSGNAALRARIHHHLGDRLQYSAAVGLTDWDALAPSDGLPGPKPTLFFAPSQIRKRAAEWGPGGLEQRVATAWGSFLIALSQWMTVTRVSGLEEAMVLYRALLHGNLNPRDGYIIAV